MIDLLLNDHQVSQTFLITRIWYQLLEGDVSYWNINPCLHKSCSSDVMKSVIHHYVFLVEFLKESYSSL